MTPLLTRLARDQLLPKMDRLFTNTKMARLVLTAVPFECTAIADIAEDLADRLDRNETKHLERLAFLPAPVILIEISANYGGTAYLLRQINDENAEIWIVNYQKGSPPIGMPGSRYYHSGIPERWYVSGSPGILKLKSSADLPVDSCVIAHLRSQDSRKVVAEIYALLACINTPRVINRKTHMPHAGLQRKLAASQGMTGKFPYGGWTEIKLEVRPPHDEITRKPREAYLTGGKALHWCRAHLRIAFGKLIFVVGHERGDASLGVKHTKYALAPPKNGLLPQWAI